MFAFVNLVRGFGILNLKNHWLLPLINDQCEAINKMASLQCTKTNQPTRPYNIHLDKV